MLGLGFLPLLGLNMNFRLMALGTLLALGASSQAVTLFSDDFESRTLGNIGGQGIWGTDASTQFLVASDAGKFVGTKSLKVNHSGAGAGTTWAYPTLAPSYTVVPSSGVNVLNLSADFYMESGSFTGTGSRQYGFEIFTTSFSTVASARFSSDGKVVSFGTGTTTTTGVAVPFDTFFNFRLSLNYTSGQGSMWLNGAQVGSNFNFNTALTSIGDGDIRGTNLIPPSSSVSGSAYADNYKFEAVPEPASMAALGLGILGLARRRRSSK